MYVFDTKGCLTSIFVSAKNNLMIRYYFFYWSFFSLLVIQNNKNKLKLDQKLAGLKCYSNDSTTRFTDLNKKTYLQID